MQSVAGGSTRGTKTTLILRAIFTSSDGYIKFEPHLSFHKQQTRLTTDSGLLWLWAGLVDKRPVDFGEDVFGIILAISAHHQEERKEAGEFLGIGFDRLDEQCACQAGITPVTGTGVLATWHVHSPNEFTPDFLSAFFRTSRRGSLDNEILDCLLGQLASHDTFPSCRLSQESPAISRAVSRL